MAARIGTWSNSALTAVAMSRTRLLPRCQRRGARRRNLLDPATRTRQYQPNRNLVACAMGRLPARESLFASQDHRPSK